MFCFAAWFSRILFLWKYSILGTDTSLCITSVAKSSWTALQFGHRYRFYQMVSHIALGDNFSRQLKVILELPEQNRNFIFWLQEQRFIFINTYIQCMLWKWQSCFMDENHMNNNHRSTIKYSQSVYRKSWIYIGYYKACEDRRVVSARYPSRYGVRADTTLRPSQAV